MKRVLKYIGLAFGAALAISSCSKNLDPKFDDKDAFVAFESSTYAVAEDYSQNGAVYRVPVTLASVAGIETTVKYEVTAPKSWKEETGGKGAIAGTDYELVDESGVLSFNAEKRTCYIEFRTKVNGAYTGDLVFDIEVFGNDDIAAGSDNKCTVTITDIDHPLASILGTYTASGEDNWDGQVEWTLTILKDEKDDHKVWINNLANNVGNKVFNTYGNVNNDLDTINIPLGQTFTLANGATVTLKGVTPEGGLTSSGSVNAKIINTNGQVTLDFGDSFGFAYGITAGGSGYYAIVWPGIKAVKN